MSNPIDDLTYLFPYIAFTSALNNYQTAIQGWQVVCDQLNSNGAQDPSGILSFASVSDIQNLLNSVHAAENAALGSFQNFVNNNPPQN